MNELGHRLVIFSFDLQNWWTNRQMTQLSAALMSKNFDAPEIN
jgi:hypothetical protein